MKPKVSYAEFKATLASPWDQAWERLKDLPPRTKLTANGITYTLVWASSAPHPRWLQLSYRAEKKQQSKMVRVGDMLICELQPF